MTGATPIYLAALHTANDHGNMAALSVALINCDPTEDDCKNIADLYLRRKRWVGADGVLVARPPTLIEPFLSGVVSTKHRSELSGWFQAHTPKRETGSQMVPRWRNCLASKLITAAAEVRDAVENGEPVDKALARVARTRGVTEDQLKLERSCKRSASNRYKAKRKFLIEDLRGVLPRSDRA